MNEQEIKDLAFVIFASAYPLEAYDSDPVAFCNFMKKQGYYITDEEIKTLIDEAR